MPLGELFVRRAGSVARMPGPAPATGTPGSAATIGELTETLGLARHRARTFWGLLTRAAATILAHTLLRLRRV